MRELSRTRSMWVFSRACSTARTLQPSPSSSKHQQRLQDKSIQHPPPGKQAEGQQFKPGSAEQQLLRQRHGKARDEDPPKNPTSPTRQLPSGASAPRRLPAGEPPRPRPSCPTPTLPAVTPPAEGKDQNRPVQPHSIAPAARRSPPSSCWGRRRLGLAAPHQEALHSWKLSAGQEERALQHSLPCEAERSPKQPAAL